MSGFGPRFPGVVADWTDPGMDELDKDSRVIDGPTSEHEPKSPKGAKSTDDRETSETRTPAIAGLAIAVILLVLGLWLVRELTAASKMQDCLMSGRTNCNVIQPQ
jgi:hypothetical protein